MPSLTYPDDMEILGAEFKALRGFEAVWDWFTKVDNPGPTFFKDFLNQEYSTLDQRENDTLVKSQNQFIDEAAPAQAGNHESRKSFFETNLLENFFGKILAVSSIDAAAGPITYTYVQSLLEVGEVQIEAEQGFWGAIRRDMIANGQTIIENIITLGAFNAVGVPVGVLIESGDSAKDHTLTGTFRFTVTDDTVGDVKITVENILPFIQIGGEEIIAADNTLTVGKPFEDGPTGLSITLSLGAVVVTGDDGTIFSTTPVITTPSDDDSDKGKYYIEVERLDGVTADYIVRVFSNANLDTDFLQATKEVIGLAGAETLTIPLAISTIVVDFDKTAATVKLPVVTNKDSDIVFDIKSPRNDDSWEKSASSNEQGNFATILAHRWRARLNSVTSGSETISDTLAQPVPMT